MRKDGDRTFLITLVIVVVVLFVFTGIKNPTGKAYGTSIYEPRCGDGIIQLPEECDPPNKDPGVTVCQSLYPEGGPYICSDGCFCQSPKVPDCNCPEDLRLMLPINVYINDPDPVFISSGEVVYVFNGGNCQPSLTCKTQENGCEYGPANPSSRIQRLLARNPQFYIGSRPPHPTYIYAACQPA